MQTNARIIACTCGLSYARSERLLPIKDIGLFECEACGARIEMWSRRTVPLFKRIEAEAPDRRRA